MTRKMSPFLRLTLSTLLSVPALSSMAFAQDNPNPGAPAAAPTPGTASVPGDQSPGAAVPDNAQANPTQGAAGVPWASAMEDNAGTDRRVESVSRTKGVNFRVMGMDLLGGL